MIDVRHPMIHEPKHRICLTGSWDCAGISNSPTFPPRLRIQMPCSPPGSSRPHAAKTRSFQAHVAVIGSGVSGLLRKTRLSPFRRSYVWTQRPTEVVSWNVVLPNGIEVKGTAVGETKPTVWKSQEVSILHTASGTGPWYPEWREDA